VVRWAPDARGRLQQAAFELYGERGYENTTVAEIAEHAGLTKRTFFRYFADKREVLFSGAQALQKTFVAAVVEAPESATALEAMAAALDAAAVGFEERREFAAQRQRIVNANPELQERERSKLASLAAAVAEAMRARGVAEPAATLVADAGITVFRAAFEAWVQAGNERRLQQIVHVLLDELVAVMAG
jgi:AcrR family transcriptional regulator